MIFRRVQKKNKQSNPETDDTTMDARSTCAVVMRPVSDRCRSLVHFAMKSRFSSILIRIAAGVSMSIRFVVRIDWRRYAIDVVFSYLNFDFMHLCTAR